MRTLLLSTLVTALLLAGCAGSEESTRGNNADTSGAGGEVTGNMTVVDDGSGVGSDTNSSTTTENSTLETGSGNTTASG